MGLITKTVKIKWWRNNKKWYESKGYIFTKYKEEFEVKVEDLTDSSNVFIDSICDNCGKELKPMRLIDYKKLLHNNEKYYCYDCAIHFFRKNGDMKGKKKSRRKIKKTFYDWCIENDRWDILNRWDYEFNKCSPKDITFRTSKKYYFKCPKDIHPSELKNIDSFVSGQEGSMFCKACNSVGQYIIDNYGEDMLYVYWDKEKNDKLGLDPFKVAKGNNEIKIWIFCQAHKYHGSYEIGCAEFVYGGRCSYCGNYKVHPLDSLGYYIIDRYGAEFLYKVWSEKNKKSPFEYSYGSTKKVWFKCLDGEHEDYKREIRNSVRYEFRCPKCVNERKESIIQEKTRLYLEENYGQYQILHEQYCTLKPKNIIETPNSSDKKRIKGVLRYDNEIIINDKHLFIEVMGEQHEKISLYSKLPTKKYNTTPEQEFKYLQDKDKYKKQYVYDQGDNYYYLELSYKIFNKNDTYKQLINNKINKILNRK